MSCVEQHISRYITDMSEEDGGEYEVEIRYGEITLTETLIVTHLQFISLTTRSVRGAPV